MEMSMTLAGNHEVARKLDRISAAAQGRALRTGVTAAALPIQNRWKELARVKTGAYRSSIHTEVEDKPGDAQATIGTSITDPPYPFFLEYGTSRMPAYPAMRPAFDETKGEALNAGTRAMKHVLEREAG